MALLKLSSDTYASLLTVMLVRRDLKKEGDTISVEFWTVATGFYPQTGIEEGLKKMYASFERAG